MLLTINDLTVNFKHLNCEQLLEDWRWLIGTAKQPILLSAAGDAFLQDAEDGSIHLLDVVAGELLHVAKDLAELRALLADREFVANHFAVALVMDLWNAGIVLRPGEIYSFRHPPILNGEYTLENIEPTDINVHFSLMGQIHQQVRGMNQGDRIGSIRIMD